MKPKPKKPVVNRATSGVMTQRELAEWYQRARSPDALPKRFRTQNATVIRNHPPRGRTSEPLAPPPTASSFAEMMHEAGVSRDEMVVAINNQGFSASEAAAAADAVCNARGGPRFDFVKPIMGRELTPSEAEGLRRQRDERAEVMARVRRTENAAVLERVRAEADEAVANRRSDRESPIVGVGVRDLDDAANERARRFRRPREN